MTPISTSDKDAVEGTVSPSVTNTRSKTSDVTEPLDCPVKFDNLEDFLARVSEQIKRAQSLGVSTDQFSPIDKISTTQKFTPSVEMLATAKGDIERLLVMPSVDLILPEKYSALSAALAIYAAAPDLSAERARSLKKLKENLPHLSSTLCRAKKDQEEYYKKASKKVLLIAKLTKYQELYADFEEGNDNLEYQISDLEARLKDAKTKRGAVHEQTLNLAKRCFQMSSALYEMEAEFLVQEEMKVLIPIPRMNSLTFTGSLQKKIYVIRQTTLNHIFQKNLYPSRSSEIVNSCSDVQEMLHERCYPRTHSSSFIRSLQIKIYNIGQNCLETTYFQKNLWTNKSSEIRNFLFPG